MNNSPILSCWWNEYSTRDGCYKTAVVHVWAACAAGVLAGMQTTSCMHWPIAGCPPEQVSQYMRWERVSRTGVKLGKEENGGCEA